MCFDQGGEGKSVVFCRSGEARVSEFRWFAEVRSRSPAREINDIVVKRRGAGNKTRTAPGLKSSTRAQTGRNGNGLFAREIIAGPPPAPPRPGARPLDGLETRRFELRNSTPRRVIVTRFHRQRDIRDTLASDIVARKVASRQCAAFVKTFDANFPAPRRAAPRVFTRQILLHCSRANTIYIYIYIYRHTYVCIHMRIYTCIYTYIYICTSLRRRVLFRLRDIQICNIFISCARASPICTLAYG